MLYRKTALFGLCEDDTSVFEQMESPFIKKSKAQLNSTSFTVCRKQYLHFCFLFHLLNWVTVRYFPESHRRTTLENYGALSKVQRTFHPYLLAMQKVANTVNSGSFKIHECLQNLPLISATHSKPQFKRVHFRPTHSQNELNKNRSL